MNETPSLKTTLWQLLPNLLTVGALCVGLTAVRLATE